MKPKPHTTSPSTELRHRIISLLWLCRALFQRAFRFFVIHCAAGCSKWNNSGRRNEKKQTPHSKAIAEKKTNKQTTLWNAAHEPLVSCAFIIVWAQCPNTRCFFFTFVIVSHLSQHWLRSSSDSQMHTRTQKPTHTPWTSYRPFVVSNEHELCWISGHSRSL